MPSKDSSALTETLDLLAHSHRRYVLYYLTNESEVTDVDTLAAEIAAWDDDHSLGPGADHATDRVPGRPTESTPDRSTGSTPDRPTVPGRNHAVGVESDGGTTGGVEAIATALHHVHLPRLAEAGVVRYATGNHAVEFAGAGRIAPVLDATARLDGYAPHTAD